MLKIRDSLLMTTLTHYLQGTNDLVLDTIVLLAFLYLVFGLDDLFVDLVAAIDRVAQRRGRHEFHHDGRPAIILDDVVHADHVRVAEPRGQLRLSHRAAAAGFPLSILHLRWQDDLLDRHIPGEQFVAGTPDHAHPAAADDGTKPVPSGKEASWLRHGHFRRLPEPDAT